MKRTTVAVSPVAPTLQARLHEAQMRRKGEARNVRKLKAINVKTTKSNFDLAVRCRLRIFNAFICPLVCYPKYNHSSLNVKIFHQNVLLCQHKNGRRPFDPLPVDK